MFRPYAGVSTAILIFTCTGVGGSDHGSFYDVRAEGLSLDDKRTDLLAKEKQGLPSRIIAVEERTAERLPAAMRTVFDVAASTMALPKGAPRS